MRLTQIKLSGFKSFVDPVSIQVPSQLVGVVGPNGCGKSNIIDAVRWVLGETRASELRGESMLDVIFNGSTHRKPAARASVELVFDNQLGRAAGQWSTYAEIAIKRVLTRDGTSSYYVNQQQVRRKDIHDIFMGTGLGAKGYAIIGQGMIARIIEARPEELRVFLEEAAGVSRYKERRRETENRLADTRDNLIRVEDILQELTGQIVKLEAQAEVAKQYQAWSSEGEQTLQLLWLIRQQDAAQEQQKLNLEIEKAQTDLEGLVSELRSIEAELEVVRQDNYAAADVVHQAQAEVYEANATVARLEAEIKYVVEARQRLQQQQAQQQQQEQHWSEQIAQAAEQEEMFTVQHEELLVQKEIALNQWQEQAEKLPTLEAQYKEQMQRVQAQKEKVTQVEQAIALNAHTQREFQRQLQSIQLRQEKWLQEKKELENQTQTIRPDAQEDLQEAEEELRILQAEKTDLEADYERLEKQKNTEQQVWQSEKTRQTELEARLQALMQVQENIAQNGALAEWLETQGLAGLHQLWQKIQVEQGWELAVESVFRERLFALEVQDLSWTGGLLTSQPPSRFALYSATATSSSSATALAAKADLIPMVQMIQCADPSLMQVLSAWLKEVYVLKDVAKAMALRTSLSDRAAIVVPAGHIITEFGIQFYAADSEQSGMLERQQELTNLQKSIRAQQLLVESSFQQYSRAQTDFQNCAQRLPEVRKREQSAVQVLHQQQMQWQKQQQQAEHAQLRLEQMVQQLQESAEQCEELQARQEESLLQFDTLDQQLADAQSQHEDCVVAAEDLAEILEQARTKLAENKQSVQEKEYQEKNILLQLQAAKQSFTLAEQQKQRLQNDFSQLKADLEKLDDAAAQAGLQDALEVRAQKDVRLREVRMQQESVTAQLMRLEEKKQFAERSQEPRRVRIQELMLKEQASRIAVEQFDQQLSTLSFEQKQERSEQLAQMTADQRRPAALQARIQDLQQKVQGLGAVNLAALQELQASQERKQFLDAQHADLLLAIDTLESAIRKIDKETRDLLQETFDKVNGHFGTLFPSLFGGGEAKLVMTGEEILDAGVQVMAQPPGKRNSTIHLLSGGEKALTATALVFAMFKLNPAPFCLLDEVDAPLDDANTERYAKLVKNMSEQTQFLFISHNKIAMEMAHQLIGVTMQEQGVSRIVAVDIEAAMELAVEDAT